MGDRLKYKLIGAAVVLAMAYSAQADGAPPPATPVAAQPAPTFPVALSAQDGSNIGQVCKFSMDSTTLDLPTKTAVGQFCLDLLNRIGAAQKAGAEHAAAAS